MARVRTWLGWKYAIGKGNTKIWRPGETLSMIVDHSAMTGRDWNTIEKGQWKKTIDGMVKPGHVKGWIKKHLGKA